MKLTLPDANAREYTWAEYQQDYSRPDDSFCRTFMACYARCRKQKMPSMHWVGGPKNEQRAILNGVNSFYEKMRREINLEMVSFLLEHDGVIDRWPYVEGIWGKRLSDILKDFSDDGYISFPFHYMSTGYMFDGKYFRRKDSTWDKYALLTGDSPEIRAWQDEVDRLKKMEDEQRRHTGAEGFAKFCFGCLPLLMVLLILVFGLVGYFTDAAPILHLRAWMMSQPGVIKTILMWTLGLVVDIAGLLLKNKVVFWIATVLLGFFGVCGGLAFLSKFMPCSKRVYMKTLAEYRDAKEELAAWKDEWKEVTTAWNDAYLQFLKER